LPEDPVGRGVGAGVFIGCAVGQGTPVVALPQSGPQATEGKIGNKSSPVASNKTFANGGKDQNFSTTMSLASIKIFVIGFLIVILK